MSKIFHSGQFVLLEAKHKLLNKVVTSLVEPWIEIVKAISVNRKEDKILNKTCIFSSVCQAAILPYVNTAK